MHRRGRGETHVRLIAAARLAAVLVVLLALMAARGLAAEETLSSGWRPIGAVTRYA